MKSRLAIIRLGPRGGVNLQFFGNARRASLALIQSRKLPGQTHLARILSSRKEDLATQLENVAEELEALSHFVAREEPGELDLVRASLAQLQHAARRIRQTGQDRSLLNNLTVGGEDSEEK